MFSSTRRVYFLVGEIYGGDASLKQKLSFGQLLHRYPKRPARFSASHENFMRRYVDETSGFLFESEDELLDLPSPTRGKRQNREKKRAQWNRERVENPDPNPDRRRENLPRQSAADAGRKDAEVPLQGLALLHLCVSCDALCVRVRRVVRYLISLFTRQLSVAN